MSDFDPAGAERQRQIDHGVDALDIGAMHDGVDGEWQLEPHHLGCQGALARKGAVIAGDMIGGLPLAVLDRDLHMVEPGLGQRGQRLVGDADPRGDEIGVEPGVMGGGGDVEEIAPRAGLAARQVHLQHAQRRRLAEHPRPGGAVELGLPAVERQRVRAIGTAERTAVGQLGQQAERPMQDGGAGRRHLANTLTLDARPTAFLVYYNSSSRLSASPRSSVVTSLRIFSRGADEKALARSSMISPKLASPVQRLMISTAIASALNTRSGASSTQPPCASLWASRTPRGSRGRASAGML